MELLKQMFAEWAGEPCRHTLTIAQNGSSRRYYRLIGESRQCIGTVATDLRENEAFFALTQHLRNKAMPVPELYAIHPDRQHYLQQDLGDTTLYSLLHEKRRQGGGFDQEMLALYRQALTDLAAIQQAGRDFDFSLAYPRSDFDRRAILWDLNYFKYNFLKLANIDFDEELLENDLQHLADLLLSADTSFLLYRDFNPRNIMVSRSLEAPEPRRPLYYIDYQGARRGAAQYDLASLLYSAKSNIPQAIRDQLLLHYLDIRNIHGPQRQQWIQHYNLYLLIRILQTLGAYGYRGLFQRKDYFLQSIPLAADNLRLALQRLPDANLPQLQLLSTRISDLTLNSPLPATGSQLPAPNSPLTVTVTSFSFQQGLPQDPSGNGGGHIFDCRALPNPGRYPQYKTYTGVDRPVIEFLDKEQPVKQFLSNAQDIVAQSVDKYLQRNFTHLMVSFGCTGGQHRSVYCATHLAHWLKQQYPSLRIRLIHREQPAIPSLTL